MSGNHKMLGTDSDGRLGSTVRHFGKTWRVRWVVSTALCPVGAMTDGLDGRLAGWFGTTVRSDQAQQSGGYGQ